MSIKWSPALTISAWWILRNCFPLQSLEAQVPAQLLRCQLNLRPCPPRSQPGNCTLTHWDAPASCMSLQAPYGNTALTHSKRRNGMGSVITLTLGWARSETQGTNLQGMFYWFLILWLDHFHGNSVELCHARLHALILPSLAYQCSVTAESDKFQWKMKLAITKLKPWCQPHRNNLLNSSDEIHGIFIKPGC